MQHQKVNYFAIAALIALMAFSSACGDRKAATKANFETALNKHFQKEKECLALMALPNDVFGSMASFEPLTDAGILTKTQNGQKVHYDLSPKGRESWKTKGNEWGQFCYGERTVTEIERFTEPSDMGGVHVSNVTYKYKLTNISDWAKLASVQKYFTYMKTQIDSDSAPLEEQQTMFLMNDGWSAEAR
jgi:hypothetical protein